jgi:hypothetical protein
MLVGHKKGSENALVVPSRNFGKHIMHHKYLC